MKKILQHTLFLFAFTFVFSGCVSMKKYQELEGKYDLLEGDASTNSMKLQALEVENLDLKEALNLLNRSIKEILNDTADLGKNYRRLQTKFDRTNSLNDELLEKYSSLQKGTKQENAMLLGELEQTKLDLQLQEDSLNTLGKELSEKLNELQLLEQQVKEREEKVRELQEILAAKDEAVNNLRNKIASALLGFKDKGLTVEQKNGKVYVSLEAKLLFPSGSTIVDKEGETALIKLAAVLEDQADLEILVEGHTDTDKLRGTTFPHNNWELSVLRATAVVEIMTNNSSINPKQLIAAGRSMYLPVDEKNKAKNRRIEVILSPNLDKLFDLIEAETQVAKDFE
jgi:chemotaxis protein MotB